MGMVTRLLGMKSRWEQLVTKLDNLLLQRRFLMGLMDDFKAVATEAISAMNASAAAIDKLVAQAAAGSVDPAAFQATLADIKASADALTAKVAALPTS